ncbi:MAG: hypothetical protein QOJ42_507 [Acidobacteriaceae bacterium]|jgi:hypothetical protein|nr:hypothetical protein [Acidobacteriaceae bacterium]
MRSHAPYPHQESAREEVSGEKVSCRDGQVEAIVAPSTTKVVAAPIVTLKAAFVQFGETHALPKTPVQGPWRTSWPQ